MAAFNDLIDRCLLEPWRLDRDSQRHLLATIVPGKCLLIREKSNITKEDLSDDLEVAVGMELEAAIEKAPS